MTKLTKIPSNLLAGFGTSAGSEARYRSVAMHVNNAVDAFDALNADRSRSKSEKATMYKQLQTNYGRYINDSLARFEADLLARADAHAAACQRALESVSMVDAVQIVAGLKASGLSADDIRASIAENREIAVAFARAPSALSGLSGEVAVMAALKHYPELVAAEAEITTDLREFKSIQRTAAETVNTIGLNVDEQALASRFDEARLNPTEPSTQAEQNAKEAAQ